MSDRPDRRRPDTLAVALDLTPLLGPRSGVAAFVEGLVAALAGRGDLRLSGYALSPRGRRRLGAVAPPGVHPAGLPVPASGLLRLWPRLPVGLAAVVAGPAGRSGVVHGTCFAGPPSPRTVVTVHDLTPVRYPQMVEGAAARYPAAVRAAVGRGAWVHTPSRFVAAEVVELLGVPAEKVVAIHHGGPAPGRGDPARGRALAGSDRYVLAVGTEEPRKAYGDLVAAFAAVAGDHPGTALVVAGRPAWGSRRLDEAVAAMPPPVRSRVVRLGWVDDASRDDLLAGAAVLAYPSLYEGFGLPPLEALAAGVPVVATSAGALPEVLGTAAALVDPGDVDGLGAALAAALALDGSEREAVVEAGRRRAAGFTWEATAAAMVGLYRRVAGA